jgi:signal peptidase
MRRSSPASLSWSPRLRRIGIRRFLGRASLLGSLALFLLWAVFLRPVVLGGPAGYTIVTGSSMEPGMHAGDLVVSMRQDAYAVGDAIVYRIPAGEDYAGRLIVHRIIGGDGASGFVVQGDNAAHRDPWTVSSGDVIGRVAAMIPLGGRVLIFLRNPFVAGSLAAGFAFVLVVWPSGEQARDAGARRRPEPGKEPGQQPV